MEVASSIRGDVPFFSFFSAEIDFVSREFTYNFRLYLVNVGRGPGTAKFYIYFVFFSRRDNSFFREKISPQ